MGTVKVKTVFSLAICLAACDSGRGDTGYAMVLTDSGFVDSTGMAVPFDTGRVEVHGPPYNLVTLPDSVRDFDMAAAVSVAIQDAEPCLMAVVDRVETGVHFFLLPGSYAGSLFLGGRGMEALSGISHISIARDGSSFVWELGRRRIAHVDRGRRTFRVFRSDSITSSMPRLGRVIPVTPDRLIENWMIHSIPVVSKTWAEEQLPLLRVIDTDGHDHGGLWRIADRPGQLLTHALNQGDIVVQGDTLWFAYAATGQIIRAVLDMQQEPWRLENPRRIVLPQMYSSVAPKWYRASAADTIGLADVDYQMQGFGVTGSGILVVGQTFSYPPRGGGAIHVPSSAVMLYDPSGRFVRGWRANGRIRDLAVGHGYLALVMDSFESDQREIRLYRLADVLPGELDAGHCSEGR